jgi:hypothetical protein
MAAAAYDIDTLANVKSYMGIGADTDKDVLLQTLISDISKEIEDATGRTFKVQPFTGELLNGNGREKIRPLHIPIYALYLTTDTTDPAKLACVQVRDSVDEDWADVEDDLDHFWANTPALRDESAQNSHNIELYEESFPEGRNTVKLDYQAGYISIPGRIRRLFFEMVQVAYNKAKGGNNQLGLDSSGENGAGASFSTSYRDMNPEWQSILDEYKVRYQ